MTWLSVSRVSGGTSRLPRLCWMQTVGKTPALSPLHQHWFRTGTPDGSLNFDLVPSCGQVRMALASHVPVGCEAFPPAHTPVREHLCLCLLGWKILQGNIKGKAVPPSPHGLNKGLSCRDASVCPSHSLSTFKYFPYTSPTSSILKMKILLFYMQTVEENYLLNNSFVVWHLNSLEIFFLCSLNIRGLHCSCLALLQFHHIFFYH